MKRRDLLSATAGLGLALTCPGALAAKPKPPSRKSKKRSVPSEREPEGTWQELWNGLDLSGWRPHVPPARGQADGQPTEVFSVIEQAGKRLLRVSGHRFGALVSEAAFRNYQLRVEWRWGVDKWAPRAHLRRSSGLVVHSLPDRGPFGAAKPWHTGLELELQEGSCGDLLMGEGLRVDVPARRERFMGKPLYVFAAAQKPETLPQADAEPRVVKSNDYERGYGEWNVADAYLFGPDGAFVINGAMTLQFQNTRSLQGDSETPLAEGPVQLASEGAELFVRRIAVRPLDKLPDRFRIRKSKNDR